MLTDEVKRALVFEGPGLVVCVGNPLRGDDGAGPFIAAEIPPIASRHPPFDVASLRRDLRGAGDCSIHVIDAGTTPENHIDEVISLNPQKVIVIDAADFGGEPGEARIIPREAISDYALSTHSFPLGAVCELIKQSIQAEIIFIGIQVKDVALGAGMCAEVKKSAEEIIDILKTYV